MSSVATNTDARHGSAMTPGRRGSVEKICIVCSSRFFVKPCRAAAARTCSTRCRGAAAKGIPQRVETVGDALRRLARKSKDDIGGCRLWICGADKDGYGRTCFAGKAWQAHRLMYTLAVGQIPDGMLVMHTCDTPACVNPGHLRVGSAADNSEDMVSKSRQSRGAAHGRSKITESDVIRIRELYAVGGPMAPIARALGIHHSTALRVAHRERWNHVGGL